jgi:hypothetical protein
MLLRGCFRIFFFYDVGEAFDLEKLRDLLGSRGGSTKPDFPRRTPDYVRFENPPIAEPCEPITLPTGEHVICSIKYYEYAIVEVQLERRLKPLGIRSWPRRPAGWTQLTSNPKGAPWFAGIFKE